MNNNYIFTILFQIAVFGFGLNPVLSKLSGLSPYTIVAGRTVVAVLCIAIGLILFKKTELLKVKLKFIPIIGFVGISLALHWFAYFYSIKISTVAIGSMGFATAPIWIAIFEPLIFKRNYKLIDLICVIFVFIGLLLIPKTYNFADISFYALVWSVICGVLFAIVSISNRMIISKKLADPIAVSFYEYIFACPLAFIVWYYLGMPDSFTNLQNLSYIIAIGTFGTAIAHTLIINSLKHISATSANIMLSLHPVYGVVLSFLIIGEIPSFRMICGGCIILGTTIIYNLKK